MKKLLFLFAIAATIAGCSGNKNANLIPMADDSWTPDTTATDETVTASPELIEERVKAIYEQVVAAYPDVPDLTPSNDSLDIAFCSSHWQSLVELVNEKDAASLGGDHFFEADYWVMGQDWDKLSATDIKATVKDNNHADVTLNLHNCGAVIKVKLEMVFERGEWLIDNFIDQTNGMDWKKSMVEYIEKKEPIKGNGPAEIGEGIIEYQTE